MFNSFRAFKRQAFFEVECSRLHWYRWWFRWSLRERLLNPFGFIFYFPPDRTPRFHRGGGSSFRRINHHPETADLKTPSPFSAEFNATFHKKTCLNFRNLKWFVYFKTIGFTTLTGYQPNPHPSLAPAFRWGRLVRPVKRDLLVLREQPWNDVWSVSRKQPFLHGMSGCSGILSWTALGRTQKLTETDFCFFQITVRRFEWERLHIFFWSLAKEDTYDYLWFVDQLPPIVFCW